MIKSMVSLVLVTISFALSFIGNNSTDKNQLTSHVYNWDSLVVEKTKSGERRQVFDDKTEEFARFEIHATTLMPGQAPHGSHVHPDEEELILVKEGTIKQSFGEEAKILPAGSAVLALAGIEHGISNAGDTQATYYIIKWKTQGYTKDAEDTSAHSFMINWDDLAFKTSEKGGRRDVYRSATSMLTELEMHVTTLKPGVTSHAQHTHSDSELIIILKGTVEETINDKPYKAEAGSVIYLEPNIRHGIRNAGDTPCEYYAIRFIPKNAK